VEDPEVARHHRRPTTTALAEAKLGTTVAAAEAKLGTTAAFFSRGCVARADAVTAAGAAAIATAAAAADATAAVTGWFLFCSASEAIFGAASAEFSSAPRSTERSTVSSGAAVPVFSTRRKVPQYPRGHPRAISYGICAEEQ